MAVCVLVVGVAGLVGCVRAPSAWAHAGLRDSEPAAGAVLDVAPSTIRLTFVEEPVPSLAVIRVLGAGGTSYATGPPLPLPGVEWTLAVPVHLPDRRVYTVTWHVVSAVDGHPSSGSFAFGVGVPAPQGAAAASSSSSTFDLSPLGVLARWFFALGLIAVLGASTARLLGFAGTGPAASALGGAGLTAAWIGLVLLAEAQRRAAAASWGDLFDTSIGDALARRGVALGVVLLGLLLARSSRPVLARRGAWVVVAGACAAFAVHVAAGHAGAQDDLRLANVATQWAHVVAVSVWAGGLAALLLGVRGAPSPDRADSVRRFSRMAAPALAVVLVTGVLRALDTVPAWGDLASTGYGRAVVAKLLLFGGIVGLAWTNRRRAVPVAATTLRLLRRLAGGELALAVAALGAAALLSSLPPPSALAEVERPGLTASGTDAALTVQVRLTVATAVPGPNRFTVRVTDYRTGRPIVPDHVSLRFTALDDPSVPPTALTLKPGSDKTFEAAGNNLSVGGRWAVTAAVDRGREVASVRLDVEMRRAPPA